MATELISEKKMAAQLIDGKAVARRMKEEVKKEIAKLKEKHKSFPLLLAVQVGENPASASYLKSQKKGCEEVGIDYQVQQLPREVSEKELIQFIREKNQDGKITGIILQMPLPQQINAEKVFWRDTMFGFYVTFRKKMKADPKKKFYGIWSVEDLIKYIQDNPPRPQDIENFINVMNTQNAFDKLDQIKHRTLILSASHDKMVPKVAGEYLHSLLPNSIFKVIEEAGHECHYSRAPEVNKIILDFLNN